MTTSKKWAALLALVPTRAAEMLVEGQTAMSRGETLSPHRWAFVDALKWRDDLGLNRNSLQYRFADAIIKWMCVNWANELRVGD